MRTIPLLALCFIAVVAYSQTAYVSVQVDSNYNQWGWKAIILKNDLITFATVPAIGARAMKYDLGNLQSLYVNPSELGKTYTPAQNGQWHNFGGFKTWPAPQSSWNTGGWPPPPNLDCGNYTFQIDSLSPTYKAVSVSSPTEKWFAPNVRFERTATAYPGTSRIKMEQRIINDGTSAVSWSVWGVSQSIVNHPGKTDYQNYWVYFPINPNSHYGTSGVSPQGPSTAWKGEIAPGIYGVQFSTDNQKIYADPDRGWIVYADISDSVIFAKTFDVFEGAQYPDNGARVSVYVSGSVAPIYLEAEVKGPMVQLDANGGSYNFNPTRTGGRQKLGGQTSAWILSARLPASWRLIHRRKISPVFMECSTKERRRSYLPARKGKFLPKGSLTQYLPSRNFNLRILSPFRTEL